MVGGSASAIYTRHRFSFDHDHVAVDLRERFNQVLSDLEAISGWQTARVNRPVQILESLDGIQTGIRQLRRSNPLETTQIEVDGLPLTLPTLAEILRIKGYLILLRNAMRDYVDFAALGDHLGSREVAAAFAKFDQLYPQENGESPLQQLFSQIASPQPYDLDKVSLPNFKGLDARWHTWERIVETCQQLMVEVFRALAKQENEPPNPT